MKTNKRRFYHLFTYPFHRQNEVFSLFEFSFFKVLIYFFILNLVMLFPLSYGIISLDEMNFDLIDYNIEEDTPAWLPGDLPNCTVLQGQLNCDSDDTTTRELELFETNYTLYFNVHHGATIDDEHTVLFRSDDIIINMRDGITLTLDYRGFEGLDFNEVSQMEQTKGATLLFNAFFNSLHPHIALPLMIIAVGGLMAMNLLLLLIFSAISMLFRFMYSDVPRYGNMFKLFVIASSIPAMINLVLGFFGLSAFTSIVYNFLTPLIVLVIYKKNIDRINAEAAE